MDINTIMQLLSMLTSGNQSDKTSSKKNAPHQNASVFAMQNGLGKQVNAEQKSDAFGDLLKNMSSQNPLLTLIGAMQNSKGDLSSLLPFITSFMSKSQTQKNDENDTQNTQKNTENCPENPSKSSENCTQNNAFENELKDENIAKTSDIICESKQDICDDNLKEKTQQDLFAPVAFGGYQMICLLYKLLKSKRNLCR